MALGTEKTCDRSSRATTRALLLALSIAACNGAQEEDPPGGTYASGVNGAGPGGSALGGIAAGGTGGGGTLVPSDAGLPGVGLPGGGATLGGSTAGVALDGGPSGQDAAVASACSRDVLGDMVERFFGSLKAHDPSSLPLATNVKYTENGKILQPGQGLWKSAGAVTFKHSAFDADSCNSVSEAVIAEGSTGDVPFGVRLKLNGLKIIEIETIVVRSGDYPTPSDTATLAASASENWEARLPSAQRATRAQLEKILDDYFVYFPAGACYFAPECLRLENGFSPGACGLGLSCGAAGVAASGPPPRLSVIDVETGIAVAFVMSANTYTNFHMFRVIGGQVRGLHAVLAAAPSPGW